MALYLYDAAYSPDLAACKARGAAAMSHYETRSYAGTSPQPAATLALGMGVNHNWEGLADELVGASRAKGRQVAREALAALPKSTPRNGTVSIKYSVDTVLTDIASCDEVFRGINDVHKGTGVLVAVYSEGALILRLHKLGLVQGLQWLSMSESFPGFKAALTSGLVGIVQMHDAAGNWIGTDIKGTDRNTIINPHGAGIEWPPGSPYIEGAGMPLTQQDIAAIWAYRLDGDPDSTGKKPQHNASTWLVHATERAQGAVDTAAANGRKLDAVVQILAHGAGSVLQRVAALQTAVAAVAKAGAAPVQVDTAAVVAGVKAELDTLADAVVTRVKALRYGTVQ